MATHTGSEGVLKIGSDTVGEVRSYTIEETVETIEDTSLGDTARTYKVGLSSFTGSMEVFFDETDTAQTAIKTAIDGQSTVTFEVYYEGEGSGNKYFTGTAIVTSLSVNGSFDGMVEASISLQGSGALSHSTDV